MKNISKFLVSISFIVCTLAYADNDSGTLNLNGNDIQVAFYKGDNSAYTVEFRVGDRWYVKQYRGAQAMLQASALTNDIARAKLVTVTFRQRGSSMTYDVSTIQVRLKNF